MYPYQYQQRITRMGQPLNKPQQEDRQFIFPFLVGAVTGGAAVGLTRPRPVYYNPAPYYGPRPGGYGYYSNYGYYNPYYR